MIALELEREKRRQDAATQEYDMVSRDKALKEAGKRDHEADLRAQQMRDEAHSSGMAGLQIFLSAAGPRKVLQGETRERRARDGEAGTASPRGQKDRATSAVQREDERGQARAHERTSRQRREEKSVVTGTGSKRKPVKR